MNRKDNILDAQKSINVTMVASGDLMSKVVRLLDQSQTKLNEVIHLAHLSRNVKHHAWIFVTFKSITSASHCCWFV